MDVTTKLTEIIQTIKAATYQKEDTWEQYSYRKMAAAFKIPYNDVKLVVTQLRAHPNIDYRYVPTEARYRPLKYRYIDFNKNSIALEKFQQLTAKEFAYAKEKLDACISWNTDETMYTREVILLIMIEEMKKEGFLTEWKPVKIGSVVRYTGLDYRDVEQELDFLCENHILKQLGASMSYMMALSEEDYAKLDDSSYTEQFKSVLEGSQVVVETGTTGTRFQVLTELNDIADNTREFIAFNSEMGTKLLKWQKLLDSLLSKESVYAGTLVRLDAVNRNYNQTMQENQELKTENQKLKQTIKATDKFYGEQKTAVISELEAMSASLISEIEAYFSRPVREKNQPSITNRTKTDLIRIIFHTIDTIKKGKTEE